jgi:hypothetical protein
MGNLIGPGNLAADGVGCVEMDRSPKRTMTPAQEEGLKKTLIGGF